MQYIQSWEGIDCIDHTTSRCRCTLVVAFKPFGDLQIPVIRVPKRNGSVLFSFQEQFAEVLKTLLTSYALSDGNLVPITGNFPMNEMLLKFGFEYYGTETNKLIRPPFEFRNNPRSRVVEAMPNLNQIVFDLDKYYLLRSGITLRKDDICDVVGVKSLRRLCLEKLSLYHVMFSLYGGYPAVVNTQSNLTHEKIIKLFAEFGDDANGREGFTRVRNLMPKAMSMLEDFLDCSRHYDKVPFRYNASELIDYVTRATSAAGIRPGRSRVVGALGDMRIREIVDGKKADQFMYYALSFDEFIHDLIDEQLCKIKDFDHTEKFKTYCVMRLKDEFRYVWPPSAEECQKLATKCREFFIPNLLQQFLSKMLMTPRQLLERGDVIRIGQKWNFGEAQRFAEYMHAGSTRMCWHTGDINKLDKHIRDWMLTLYIQFGRPYFSYDDDLTKNLMDALFLLLSERINVKIVNHIGSVWTVIKGMMYSGGYETSHGDSWCMLLGFCLYLSHVIASGHKLSSKVDQCLKAGLIRIAIYGDDHVWCAPRALVEVLNEREYGKFIFEFCGLEVRDAMTLFNFYSTTSLNGEIKEPGVVFLKRYFVLSKIVDDPNYPLVYPFKPTHDTMIKLFCNKANLEITYPLQAIGQAYDTLGTNPVSYEMCKRFYLYYCRILKMEPSEIVREAINNSDVTTIRRLLTRSGITLEDLEKGFPSRSLLLGLHKIDELKGSNKIEFTDRDSLFKYDEAADNAVFCSGFVDDLVAQDEE